MSKNGEQIGGTHYEDLGLQPWDVMQQWQSREAFRGYLWGNVLKYIARRQEVQDLKKAKHYLERYIQEIESHDSEGESDDICRPIG